VHGGCSTRSAGDFLIDQGSQFTDQDFTSVLCAYGIAISTDRRGRFSDNNFVERLWRIPMSTRTVNFFREETSSGVGL